MLNSNEVEYLKYYNDIDTLYVTLYIIQESHFIHKVLNF